MSAPEPNSTKPYKALIKRCWEDPDFKQRLMDDPVAVIREAGLPIPPGVTDVKAIENGPSQLTIVIPPNPAELDGTDSNLVAGGYFIFSRGGFSCDFIVHQPE
ncbi:NHLP leader peptide family RiPP precursor [Endothiovibrio diazotrophicus]